ncbi:MAG TPA: dienelactone hydrolase family protein [Verrucomicrobiae bacterium]|nr:dienelactone hydrolase family protein [Verrucomicrobiae bacterium]
MTQENIPEKPPSLQQEIVLFHSAYGLRPAVLQWAQRLRDAGCIVHTPDLYDGEVFSDRMDAVRKIQQLGFDGMLARAQQSVAHLRSDLFYAGFSNGGACAELLGATRPGGPWRHSDARAFADSRSRLAIVACDCSCPGAFC